jgi:hypothetical protein
MPETISGTKLLGSFRIFFKSSTSLSMLGWDWHKKRPPRRTKAAQSPGKWGWNAVTAL